MLRAKPLDQFRDRFHVHIDRVHRHASVNREQDAAGTCERVSEGVLVSACTARRNRATLRTGDVNRAIGQCGMVTRNFGRNVFEGTAFMCRDWGPCFAQQQKPPALVVIVPAAH